MSNKRVGIIGAGIVGSALAYYLSQYDNVDVTVFEKNTVGSGTTAKSAGTVCLLDDSVSHEFWPVRLKAFQTYVEMEKREKGCTGFEQTGTLVVCTDKKVEDWTLKEMEFADAAGYPSEYWTDRDKIHRIIPDLNLDPVLSAMWTSVDGFFDATMISNTFIRWARACGVKVHIQTPVTRILVQGDRATGVDTPKGTFEFDTIVDSTGPWARRLLRQAGLETPIWHTKAEVFILEPTEPLGYPFPVLKYPRFYARKDRNNIFICRAHMTMDLSKPKEAGLFDPDELSMTGGTEAYFWDFLTDQLLEHYPRLLESTIVNDWVGYRPETIDFVPIIGDTPIQDFLMADGCGGNGVIEAPSIGTALAKYIVTGEKDPLIDRLSLSRFSREHAHRIGSRLAVSFR